MNRQAFFVLTLALACSRQTPAPGEAPASPSASDPFVAPAATTTSATPAATSSPMSTMKLLDPGRPPRHRLRYAWRADRKEQLAVDLRTATSTEIPGEKPAEVPLPPLHIVIAIDPQNVSTEGSLHYSWRVTSAIVAESQGTPSQVADGMRSEVSVIEHLSGVAEVTAQGLATDVAIDPGSVTDAGATGQMVEQVRQILRDLAAPFPDEDVGRGARWEKISQLASRDARITQTDTFSLIDLAGEKGTLDDILAQTAPPQNLEGPGGGPGAQARLESMLASGDAKTHFDLSHLAPDSRFDGTTTMVVSSQPSIDKPRRLTMTMRIEIVLSGAAR